MLIVAERINASRKAIAQAISAGDRAFIQQEAMAQTAELIIPHCHDCIALFLGSPNRHLEVFRKKPGTYYLTPG
jgi:hypothetical protein